MADNQLLQEVKHALTETRPPFRLVGAVLFGSRVKDRATCESDVDLLIVADGINPKIHRRGEQIALIKKNLPPLSLDILLYKESEVVCNFRNHNPLFLDIAEEGELVLDTDGFLENLVKETREYIRKRGIKKLDDGWVFPVRRGVATPL